MIKTLIVLGTTREEAELYDSNGPLWYRGWALESDEEVCAKVDEVLAKTGTRRMIMGHTPDFNVIKFCYDFTDADVIYRELWLGVTGRLSLSILVRFISFSALL